jgi:AP-1 complex subunit beta-1
MGLFGGGQPAAAASGGDDLMNGFSGLNMGNQAAPVAPAQGAQKKTNDDLLSLF